MRLGALVVQERKPMPEPFASVVTPVYNDEPYLEECIKSVLAQSHQDFEYIICNNHSKDRSGEIAADYAAKDSRLLVVSPPEFNPRIVLVSSYRLIGDKPDCFGVPVERSSFPGKEACRWQLLGTAYPFGSQSTVMYGAEAIRKRAPSFFPENRFFMDVDIALRLLADGDFGFVHQVLTFSRYQAETITDVASHFNSWPLLHYLMAEQYGRDFLSAEEFKKRHNEVTAEMYRGLGEQWLKDMVRREKKKGFWDFQRQHLGDIGVEIRPALLAKGVVAAGLNLMGSLGTLAKKVRNETTKGAVRPL